MRVPYVEQAGISEKYAPITIVGVRDAPDEALEPSSSGAEGEQRRDQERP